MGQKVKVVITKRFARQTLHIYQYIQQEFSVTTANHFLQRLERRVDFIIANPAIGKPSTKKQNVRSILLTPHNQLFYRCSRTVIEMLCIFDMRQHPKKKPY